MIIATIAILAAKLIEKLDYFDYGVSYNPIAVFSENIPGVNN